MRFRPPVAVTCGLSMLLVAGLAGADECSRPYPLVLPKDAPGAEAEMLDLQGKVKDYLAKANAYLDCNEVEQQKLAGALDDAASSDEAQVQIQILLTRYNNTVDEMHVVGERYNELVRAWKEASGDPSS